MYPNQVATQSPNLKQLLLQIPLCAAIVTLSIAKNARLGQQETASHEESELKKSEFMERTCKEMTQIGLSAECVE